MNNKVIPGDFQVFSTWEPYINPMYVKDGATDRLYLNEPKCLVGFKCFLLVIGTPFVHIVMLTAVSIDRIHQWKELDKVLLSPVVLLALEISALYGMFFPYDGRKLYASIERSQYGGAVLAPCFQPGAVNHLLDVSIGLYTF